MLQQMQPTTECSAPARRKRELSGFFSVIWPENGAYVDAPLEQKPRRDPARSGNDRLGHLRKLSGLSALNSYFLRAEMGEKISISASAGSCGRGGGPYHGCGAFVRSRDQRVDGSRAWSDGSHAYHFRADIDCGPGCLWFGIRQLRTQNLLPNKTIAQVQKDFESIAPEAN